MQANIDSFEKHTSMRSVYLFHLYALLPWVYLEYYPGHLVTEIENLRLVSEIIEIINIFSYCEILYKSLKISLDQFQSYKKPCFL